MNQNINISDYDYLLPQERIARFPLAERDASKLLVYRSGEIAEQSFAHLDRVLPAGAMLVFNNTKVIRARIPFRKSSGGRIELFCLEPHAPADYERAFAVRGECEWICIVGNSKKWRSGALLTPFICEGREYTLSAERVENRGTESVIRFVWSAPIAFGQILEILGCVPIPPYLGRASQQIDDVRYQTVYSRLQGSVAAPTAGLHFSQQMLLDLEKRGVKFGHVTLHVGAGTFLPVKGDDAAQHEMHTEHFEISLVEIEGLIASMGSIVAVGTTTVRTIESLTGLGYRIIIGGSPDCSRAVGQWELYNIPAAISGVELLGALSDYMRHNEIVKIKAATRIMITPGYIFRVADHIITNFHQPRSTLLLLVSAFVGADWVRIYDYALANDFRFLSYGDSSILTR